MLFTSQTKRVITVILLPFVLMLFVSALSLSGFQLIADRHAWITYSVLAISFALIAICSFLKIKDNMASLDQMINMIGFILLSVGAVFIAVFVGMPMDNVRASLSQFSRIVLLCGGIMILIRTAIVLRSIVVIGNDREKSIVDRGR